jgi:NAD(P)H-flavin reductase
VSAGAPAVERSRTTAPLGRRQAPVADRRELGAYVVLTVIDADGPPPQPGQFYMLAAAERWGGGEGERPYLGRAFSVLRAPPRRDGDGGQPLQFMVEAVGPGTARLGELHPGEGLWLTGPLGVGFELPDPGRTPLLVGGGVGIAPLAIWQDHLTAEGIAAPAVLGFRDRRHAPGAALLSDTRVATEDGSVGHRGRVTELLQAELDAGPPATVYACGPPPMLEAVRLLCRAHHVPAQLALEAGMACGFGACFGCVVATREGYLRVCVDGPVVDAELLDSALTAGPQQLDRGA